MRTSRTHAWLLCLALLAGSTLPTHAALADEPPVVLVWGGSYGWRHPSISTGEAAFVQLGVETGKFTTIVTENPADLNPVMLSQVDAVAWISTTGKPPLTQVQRDAIIRYAACGGGTLAFHAAADSNYGWADYAELIGAQFDSHPMNPGDGAARMLIEDPAHPITAGWGGATSFNFADEYYRWRSYQGLPGISQPRGLGDTNVLLALDETSVPSRIQTGATPYGHHQPVAWTKTFRGGGRTYYNNMGHSETTWSQAAFRTSLVNGVEWVTGKALDADCFAGTDPIPGPAAPPVVDKELIGKACALPAVPNRSGTWQNSGALRRLTAAGDTATFAAGLPGNLSWGAQFYVLDLSASRSAKGDVDIVLTIPNETGDYDLSVTTGWRWYGSQQPAGAKTEAVHLTDVPHCALLQVYGDNMAAVPMGSPTLAVTVKPGPTIPEDA